MKLNPDNDLMITPEATGVCGSVSYWRASGSVSIATMKAAWDAAGLDEKLFRKAPEPETALRRAVLDLARRETINDKTERRILIRPQKEASTWAVVEEIVTEGAKPVYAPLVIVSFAAGGIHVEQSLGTWAQAQAIEETVRAAYFAQQGLFAPEDITGWLVKLAYANGAVTLRDSGGVYFIPRPAMDFWNKAADAIEKATHKGHQVFRIPAMKNTEAVEAIIDAVTQEAEQEAKKIDEEIMAGLGDRALETRKTRIADLLAKVSSYEELVGREMKIRERLETLQASVATAKLVSSAPAEEGATA
jgi:hypothetical protein